MCDVLGSIMDNIKIQVAALLTVGVKQVDIADILNINVRTIKRKVETLKIDFNCDNINQLCVKLFYYYFSNNTNELKKQDILSKEKIFSEKTA